MILVKTGIGTAKHPANLGKIFFTLTVKSYTDKDILLSDFCAAYKDLESDIYEILTKFGYDNKISFVDYTNSAHYKRVEKIVDGKTTYENEFEYYYILGEYTLELAFTERTVFAELVNLFDKLASIKNQKEEYSIHINFTLTEETFAKMRAQATNNALDNIAIEVNGIAEHMGFKKTNLVLVDFNFNSNNVMYDSTVMRSKAIGVAPLSDGEKIKILDDMLSTEEDIEITSKFESKWELE